MAFAVCQTLKVFTLISWVERKQETPQLKTATPKSWQQ